MSNPECGLLVVAWMAIGEYSNRKSGRTASKARENSKGNAQSYERGKCIANTEHSRYLKKLSGSHDVSSKHYRREVFKLYDEDNKGGHLGS